MVSPKKNAKTKINFIALLSNVDSSIFKVKLNHGFKIENAESELIFKFEDRVYSIASAISHAIKMLQDYKCYNSDETKAYCITNYFYLERDLKTIRGRPIELFDFSQSLVNSYLKPTIQLMRLFREGNICMPLQYFWYLKNNKPKVLARDQKLSYVSPEPYKIEDLELDEIHSFISFTELPFKEKSLQLAFDSFNLSYLL